MIEVLKRLRSTQRGFTFIEVLVALAILGIIAAAFMFALASSSRSASLSDERTSAESLARTELEYVKNSVYDVAPWQYQLPPAQPPWNPDPPHTLPADYSGYSVNVSASLVHATDDGLQLITVVVSHGTKTVFTLTGYKVNR
jgi:prepilin-type N-terminal cleavage/methylation domain-containing protein